MKRKIALITGASRGLGRYLAQRFWENGWSLILVSRSIKSLEEVILDSENNNGQELYLYSCDLSNLSSVSEFLIQIKRDITNLDLLINNAAIHGPIGPIWVNDIEEWQNALQVNLLSPVMICQSLIPLLSKNGNGVIINMSGGGASSPRPNFSAYSTAKTGLVRFSETIAKEVRELGIQVNCIAPGAMKTDLLKEVIDKGVKASGVDEFEAAQDVFSQGGALLAKVADLAIFLASDTSKGISGKLISANWDQWTAWPAHIDELQSDLYTLRRITGKDRRKDWGDL
jgi:NAD(P)-dependent dehydrogenase (short-subunit alcohol dehydrogenase family)